MFSAIPFPPKSRDGWLCPHASLRPWQSWAGTATPPGEARTVSSGVSRASSNGRWCFLCPCTQLPGVVRLAGLGAEGPGALHSPGHGVQQAPWAGGGSRGRMRPQAALPLPTVTCVSLGTPGRLALPDRRPRGPWSCLRLVSCTRLSRAAVVSWITSPTARSAASVTRRDPSFPFPRALALPTRAIPDRRDAEGIGRLVPVRGDRLARLTVCTVLAQTGAPHGPRTLVSLCGPPPAPLKGNLVLALAVGPGLPSR